MAGEGIASQSQPCQMGSWASYGMPSILSIIRLHQHKPTDLKVLKSGQEPARARSLPLAFLIVVMLALSSTVFALVSRLRHILNIFFGRSAAVCWKVIMVDIGATVWP